MYIKQTRSNERPSVPVLRDSQSLLFPFRYTITRQDDEVYGLPIDPENVTGPWSGMVGSVSRRVYDFSCATFSVASQRMHKISFSSPIYRDWQIAVMKLPQAQSRLWMYILLNQPVVWLSIFAAIALAVLIFWFISNWSHSYNAWGRSDPLVAELQRFGYSVIYFAFTIISEGRKLYKERNMQ